MMLIKMLFWGVLVTTLFLGGCMNLTHQLLYHPETAKMETLENEWLSPWPSHRMTGAQAFRGYLSETRLHNPPTEVKKATVVVFHGNAGSAADRVYYAQQLVPMGYRVLLLEYPQYAGRSGDLGEKAFMQDGVESVSLIAQQFPEPLILIGESLGAAVASATYAHLDSPLQARVSGVMLVTPWDTLAAIAKQHIPGFVVDIMTFFGGDRYHTIDNLSQFQGNLAVIAAQNDTIIPTSHSENLWVQVNSPRKRWWLIKSATHNDWNSYVNGAWWQQVMSFLMSQAQPNGETPLVDQ